MHERFLFQRPPDLRFVYTLYAATRLAFVSVRCECVNTYSADDLQSECIFTVNIGKAVYGVVALTWLWS